MKQVIASIILSAVIGASVVAASHLLACGFGTSSTTLAQGFDRIAKPDRTVTVRGFSEREVEADLAVWNLTFMVGGTNSKDLQKDIEAKTQRVVAYLAKQGLEAADFRINAPSIEALDLTDRYAASKSKYSLIARQSILVRSSKVGAVKAAQSNSLELLAFDIAFEQGWESNVQYEYTQLNAIKPEMIELATKNARESAMKFAQDSESNVGKIKKASQGYFSIEDATPGLPEKKKVRVVTTIEYVLND